MAGSGFETGVAVRALRRAQEVRSDRSVPNVAPTLCIVLSKILSLGRAFISIRSHRATGRLRDFYDCITVVGCVYVFSLPFAQIKTRAKLFVFRDASRRADTITDDEVGSLDRSAQTVLWSIVLPSILSFRSTNRINRTARPLNYNVLGTGEVHSPWWTLPLAVFVQYEYSISHNIESNK